MKCLDSQLWHACAGGMVQMPPVNSDVFYFPQGHAEHADDNVDFGDFPRIPPFILCRVIGINYLAETHTDEVYAKIRLIPLPVRNTANDFNLDDDDEDGGIENQEKPTSFAKTLTQSDANNGGGFSVPRYCAETIFPRLDYSADPPVQTILAKDVHGEIWKFRHIYRGTPRRHLLTTGWSNFVNQKKLVAGDSIVFLRAENGDLRVGIRRAKRSSAGSVTESSLSPYGWNPPLGGGYCSSPFLREAETKKFMMRSGSGNDNGNGKGRVTAECVVEAATLAANGQPFEVVYRPQLSAPEFCVKASAVRAAMTTPWCSGMRFKMAFETEDSSRISWFMGTISSVQVDDPIRWSNSPWRLLQVAWDEPDLLQNVKRVSPWLVELVSNMPAVHLSPFSPTRKKTRIAQAPDFPFIGQFPVPSFLGNPLKPTSPFPLCCVSDNIPAAGIQGARHAHLGPSSADHLKKLKLQSSLFPVGGFEQLGHAAQPRRFPIADNREEDNESVSCLLAMGLSSTPKLNKDDKPKTPPPMFMLFGQPIHTGQQISENSWFDLNPDKTSNFSDTSGSGSAVVQNGPPENSSDDGSPNWYNDQPKPKSEFGLEATRMAHCKVFMESENVGRTLDLSAMGSHVWLGSISDGEQHSLSGCC